MENLTIRHATRADAASLALAGAATFLDTYAQRINGADIVAHAASKHSEAFYAQHLADPQTDIWVAHTETGAIVGYLMLGPATLPSDAPHPDDLEIIRIYILSQFQKTGIGHHLMQQAFAEASARRARQVVLGVFHGNEKAIAFYIRQGFSQIGTRSFQVGATVFHDLVLGRNIGANTKAP